MKIEQRESLLQLIKEIPKTEIHLHLEGMSTADTIWTLMDKNKLKVEGVTSRKDLISKFNIKSLEEFVWLYINIIQNCFKTPADLLFLIDDARKYFLENNIVYSEVFFSPSKFLQNGFDFKKMVTLLGDGAKMLQKENGIELKFIIDVSRTFGPDNAMKNLDLTIRHRNEHIIGIGLGGSEMQGPAKDYREVFEKAKKAGLVTVAHAGEDVGPESVWDAINYLHAQRIGHGISSINDDTLMEHLKKTQIPLEVCPTSNIFTRKFAGSMESHPIRRLFDYGLYITLNTDDPTLFGVDLVSEYMNLYDYLKFTPQELFHLLKNNIFATTMPIERKTILWENGLATIKNAGFSL